MPSMLKRARFKFSKPYEKRVFVGGNYDFLPTLRKICDLVVKTGFLPVLAFDYDVPEEMIYSFDLGLLGECKYAIFEITAGNGHLMELNEAINLRKNVFALYSVRDRRQSKPPHTVSSMLTTANIVLLGYDSIENLEEIIYTLFPSIEEDLPATLLQVLKVACVPSEHAQTVLSYLDSSERQKKKIENNIADIKREAEKIQVAEMRGQVIGVTERLESRLRELDKKLEISKLTSESKDSEALEEEIAAIRKIVGSTKEYSDWKTLLEEIESLKETHIPREVVEANLQRLESKIDNALELIAERAKTRDIKRKDVFIVHGISHKPMKELKMMLYDFGLNPIVLHEQPSSSKTIIEKLENHSNVSYAFVVLTPDDLGCIRNEYNISMRQFLRLAEDGRKTKLTNEKFMEIMKMMKKRARQNVVLEFGYFVGLLGRDRVCCLHNGDVELPSDMHGMVYIPFIDSVEEVRYMIIKELTAAGFEIKI